MALYQSKSKPIQSQVQQYVSLAIMNQEKVKDPNINIVNGIHNIKGRTSVNILVTNYSNKHITFNKGEYIGHLEDINEEYHSQPHENLDAYTTSSVTTKRMMSEQVELDTFEPPHHKLKSNIKTKLEALLKEYESQFALDETSIGTTPLTEMSIDTGNSEPVSQKPYPIARKQYQWVKDKIEKLLSAKVIWENRSSWSAPVIVVPKGDRGKHLVIDYQTLNKVTSKFIWPIPKVEDIFSQVNGAKYFSTLDLRAGYHGIPLDEESIPQAAFTSSFGKFKYVKVPFGLAQAPAYFQELMTGILKDFNFAIAYLDNIIIFSKTVKEHIDHIKQVFKKLRSAHL